MESDNPLKEGYLLIPSQGVFGHLKKSWQKRYCQLYQASKYGIERLEFFDNEEDANSNASGRFITLENCVKITPDPQKIQANVFVVCVATDQCVKFSVLMKNSYNAKRNDNGNDEKVVTKTSTYHFASMEENEMTEWLSAFQSVAFKEGSKAPRIEEDNDLYCPSGEGVFLVKLATSEVSARCGLEPGPYTLLLTSSAIQLCDSKEHHVLYTWPYFYIRKYGYRDGKFTFEAGRKCETGEGEFQLEHSNPQEIYRCLSLKMKSMRKLIGGQMNSTASIFCTDASNQLQAALNMEARSRSPLPPSPNSSTNILEMDLSSSSQFKSVDCISNLPCNNNPPPLKPKAMSYNNLFHAPYEGPPIPNKPKPIISPTSETNTLSLFNSPPHLQPKNVCQNSLDKVNNRKSPNLFRATVVDIDINDTPDYQSKHSDAQSGVPPPPLKEKPLKPPRKSPFISNSQKSANEKDISSNKRFFRQKSEPTGSKQKLLPQNSMPNMTSESVPPPYDEVEIRHDAWKTHGVDEMAHTERPFSHIDVNDVSPDYEILEKSPDENKLKELQVSDKANGAMPKVQKPKFLPIKPISVLGNYDTLQHFGNTSKTNGKSGYKHVIINHSNANGPSTPEGYSLLETYANNQNLTYHDYDEVDEPIEPCRLADDSHLGYGMIRKKSDAQSQSDLRFPPKHKNYNKMEYAVITKSKQV